MMIIEASTLSSSIRLEHLTIVYSLLQLVWVQDLNSNPCSFRLKISARKQMSRQEEDLALFYSFILLFWFWSLIWRCTMHCESLHQLVDHAHYLSVFPPEMNKYCFGFNCMLTLEFQFDTLLVSDSYFH